MATKTETHFELSRTYATGQATLFNAFIDPDTLRHIWGVSTISVDARPRGHTRAELSFASENWNFTITYLEVIPYERLRWTIHFDRFPTKEPRATLSFSTVPNGARVTVRMENFESAQECGDNKQAWEGALAKLADRLRGT